MPGLTGGFYHMQVFHKKIVVRDIRNKKSCNCYHTTAFTQLSCFYNSILVYLFKLLFDFCRKKTV